MGGAIIPLWFFPDVLKNVSKFLPFTLLYQFPQSVFINKISNAELNFYLISSIVWIFILFYLSYALWLYGKKKLVIQGG
jgi:ABC-2 type transport system permease protein